MEYEKLCEHYGLSKDFIVNKEEYRNFRRRLDKEIYWTKNTFISEAISLASMLKTMTFLDIFSNNGHVHAGEVVSSWPLYILILREIGFDEEIYSAFEGSDPSILLKKNISIEHIFMIIDDSVYKEKLDRNNWLCREYKKTYPNVLLSKEKFEFLKRLKDYVNIDSNMSKEELFSENFVEVIRYTEEEYNNEYDEFDQEIIGDYNDYVARAKEGFKNVKQ